MSVSPRPPREQQEHDRAIEDIALRYLAYGRLVLTNPGGARRVAVGRIYPDIIVKERVPAKEARREPRILMIAEVETGSTVSAEEAATWRALRRLGPPVALYVPHDSVAEAERILVDERLAIDELWGFRYVHGRIQCTPGRVPNAAAAGEPRSTSGVP